jgi:NAD(P)-dependent dehydrogenase (short-subunit alcohol dehydrogenase family)
MRSLDDKVVVITGAGSGIGRALALNAAAKGALLALSDVDEVGLLETADRAQARMAREVRSDRLDVRDRQATKEYAASVHAQFGRVNVVFNNAGVALHGEFEETSYEQFEWVMDVNFWGVVHGTKEFLPYLIESGDGHVVNISSLFGLMGMPGQSAYNASKFAVRGFTEALRVEMLVAKHPVQVSCVHPGGIKTAIARNARTTDAHDPVRVAELFDEKLARTTADKAAQIIVDGMLANKARVVVGADAQVLDKWVRLVGSGYQRTIARLANRIGPKPVRARIPRPGADENHVKAAG